MRKLFILVFAAAIVVAPQSDACQGNGQCKGKGQGKGGQHRHGQSGQSGHGGQGMNCRMDESRQADMEVFHFLLDNGDKVNRTVTEIASGVETLTESDDPEIAEKIRTHVVAMESRLIEGRPIHMRDPLYAEIFANASKIEMKIESTEKGVRVVETSTDPYVAKLIQAHAVVIGKFIENGRAEARKNHELPPSQ